MGSSEIVPRLMIMAGLFLLGASLSYAGGLPGAIYYIGAVLVVSGIYWLQNP